MGAGFAAPDFVHKAHRDDVQIGHFLRNFAAARELLEA
jgi:hypothetical protein